MRQARRVAVSLARKTRLGLWRLERRSTVATRRAAAPLLGRYREVVTSYDHWAYLAELAQAVSDALDAGGVEHLVISDAVLTRPIVAIRHTDAGAARRALADHPGTAACWLAPSLHGVVSAAHPAAWRVPAPPPITGLLVTRNLVTPDGLPISDREHGVMLDLWSDDDGSTRNLGGSVPPGALLTRDPNGVLNFVGPQAWAQAQRNGHRLPPQPPHILQVTEPVDIVYTWVDGDDPAWQARKRAALGTGLAATSHSADAAIAARYDSRDELRYSLRSVQQFANWVRRIWVVTDRQRPSWLVPDERLTVVDHRDIFADPAALPAFNSHAIESQLHHIPGLADHYLYLNDDMLFGAPARPEMFFHSNGMVKFFPSPALIDPRDHTDEDQGVTAAAKNNRDFIERTFDRTITNKLRHTPQAQSRSLLEDFEREHPEIFEKVMRSRFRNRADNALPSSLSQYYAFARGRAVPGVIRHAYVDLGNRLAEHALENWLRRRDFICLCINDSGDTTPQAQAALARFFEEYFPLPSVWEIDPDARASLPPA